MTPKRFKAVCTETGREFGVFEPTRSVVSMPISRDGKAKWFSWGHINVYEDIEDFTSKYNPELCQSTGLTDAKGREIYEGDVLFMIVDDDLMLFCVERSSSNTCIELCPMDGDYRFVEPIDNYVEDNRMDHVVIGNKWQPAAELQARAEAASNEL